ncbi:MAG: LON peptidase substrate-binding domain-containing protein [Verrucomicrobiota bacterium]|nr:LON peptidase substrate-binding domain-containing protein [Verrucomicrobiota bacterium]
MTVPDEIPIMRLSNVFLFPQALLPLHIFEPQYRAMLADCLESDRMFAIDSSPHVVGSKKRPKLHKVAGVGIIRACVNQKNGTSNLILQGIQRVRILDYIHSASYPKAHVKTLESTFVDTVEVDALCFKLKELLSDLNDDLSNPSMVKYLKRLENAEILTDLVSYWLLKTCEHKREVLETMDLRERLRKVRQMLIEECASGKLRSEPGDSAK